MINYKEFLLSALLCCLVAGIYAQNPDLPTGEVDVIKEFEARLIDAERFVVNPQLPPLDTAKRRLDYSITSKALQVQYLPPTIKPLSLSPPNLGEIYNGYARLGAGFPQALYLDAGYDLVNDSPFSLGIDLFHHMANNNSKVENQKFSNSMANLYGGLYNEELGFTVKGNIGYKRDVVHFYGYNDLEDDFGGAISFAADDVKQYFSNFYGNARLENAKPTIADVDYSAGIDFYSLQDNYAARETGLRLDAGATKWFADRHPLSVKLIADFTSYRDTAKQTLHNYFLQPAYGYHGDRFKVKVGLNLASHQDEFYVFPDVEASANLVENILTAFAGARGGLYKNSFRNLSDYSPYIVSRIRVENSFYNKFYGGVKGEFKGFDYRAEVSYEDVDQLALFISNRDSIPRFNVVYDTATIISVSGELVFPVFENFDIQGSIVSRVYSLEREEKAWHLPSLSFQVGAIYRMFDNKLTIKGNLFIENGVPVLAEDGNSKNLNALLDLSASAEYMFTDKIGGFVRVNNIANNRRQRWHHYPVFGLNGVVGITAKF